MWQQLEIEAAAWLQERFALYKSSDKRSGHLVFARKLRRFLPQTRGSLVGWMAARPNPRSGKAAKPVRSSSVSTGVVRRGPSLWNVRPEASGRL